jgi:hypothetical protein
MAIAKTPAIFKTTNLPFLSFVSIIPQRPPLKILGYPSNAPRGFLRQAQDRLSDPRSGLDLAIQTEQNEIY